MDATVKGFGLNHRGSSDAGVSKLNFDKRLLRYVPFLIGFLVIAIIAVLLILQINKWLTEESGKPKQTVQVVSLIKPKLPEPEIEKLPEQKVEQKIETPELEQPIPEMPDNVPASNLGIDAEGGAGDGFGIVGRKGGRGLLDGDQFGWYKQIISTTFTEALNKIERINKISYSVDLKIWISLTGKVIRFQVVKSTGDKAIDQAIIKGIPNDLDFGQQRPPGMEKTVTIRVVSRK